MSLRINHNIAAVNGHRNMQDADMRISRSLEKLSSGLRINRAADDAAGLIISEQMRAQITGLHQAIDNAETGIAMVQTAEGALDEVNSLLNKARELALHAANEGANSIDQLIADQSELDNIIDSINRIADNTQFGTKRLLDGSLSNATSNNSAVSSVRLGGDYTSQLNAQTAVKGFHTLEVTSQATQASNEVEMPGSADIWSGGTLTAATGTDQVRTTFTMSVNGATITVTSGTTKNQFLQQLNALGNSVGFTAATTGAGGLGDLVLTAQEFGRSFDFDVQFVSGATGASTLTSNETAGIDAAATLFLYTGEHGVGGTATSGASETIAFTADGSNQGGIGLRMTSSGGSTIVLSSAVSTGVIIGAIDGTSAGATFQIGANVNQTATVELGNTHATQLGVGGSGIYTDLNQVKGNALIAGNANEALKVIDVAITDVTTIRGELGAFQANTLETTVSSLRVSLENLASAESTIRDVDFAAESAEFTRNNIMMQASTAMLSQANQLPQNVLQLLQ
jgi:flagellin